MLHNPGEYFSKRSDQKYIKYGLIGPMGSRSEDANQYKKSLNKWKEELKALSKQNKMLYSISKKSGSRCELKNIKKIKDKFSKKHYNSGSNYSTNEYYSESSLSIDSV